MSKHTPGPWRAEYPGPDILSDNLLVASLVVDSDEPEERAHANARLIAAAPTLLEALKAVRAAKCGTLAMAKAFEACDLAIAKAEGTTK